jgi:catechol 2,3-dioxygenase-like lactoylglutathione lyase family enzyme
MREAVENLVTLFERGTLSRGQLIEGLLAAAAPPGSAASAGFEPTPGEATFRGLSLNHVTLSVTDVERSKAFYSRMLGGAISWQSQPDAEVQGATLRLPDCFIGLFKLGEPKIHHFCVGVERFAIDSAVEKLKTDFPESRPLTYRGEELYFHDPDGLLGQVSAVDYGRQR